MAQNSDNENAGKILKIDCQVKEIGKANNCARTPKIILTFFHLVVLFIWRSKWDLIYNRFSAFSFFVGGRLLLG